MNLFQMTYACASCGIKHTESADNVASYVPDFWMQRTNRRHIMTQHHDETYLNLLTNVLDVGVSRHDRTGVGTVGIFSSDMKFDLRDGSIPLLTTKKMHIPSIIHEILWYLRGNTNIKYLNDNGVRIWNEWADSNGNLGPLYGRAWRCIPYTGHEMIEVDENISAGIDKPALIPESKLDYVDYQFIDDEHGNVYGECNCQPPVALYDLWLGMFDTNQFVDQHWRNFNNFICEIEAVPCYELWRDNPSGYVLSVSYYRACHWSLETCVFLHKSYERELDETTPDCDYYAIEESSADEPSVIFDCAITYTDRNSTRSHSDILNQIYHNCEPDGKYKYEPIESSEGKMWRRKIYIDQVADVIEKIKTDPTDRRLIVSAWNVSELSNMRLPPCHFTYQFYVNGDELSCKLTQRSADVGLGVPYNIAQYSILLRMVAMVTGLHVGDLIWSGGDIHVYKNHIDQLQSQLTRAPFPSPTLVLKNVGDIDKFVYSDFTIEDYKHHDALKMKVAV